MTSFDRPVTRGLYLALLHDDRASPFLPSSDEESDESDEDGDEPDEGESAENA